MLGPPLAQFNANDLRHRKKKRTNANRINKCASEITCTEDDYDKHILSLNIESIRTMAALWHLWLVYNMSPEVLRKTPTLDMTSFLYSEEEYLFYASVDDSSDVYRATNIYLRAYYCMPLPPLIVCLRVLRCIRAIAAWWHMWSDYNMSIAVLRESLTLGMTSVLYPEEEYPFYAYADESSDVC